MPLLTARTWVSPLNHALTKSVSIYVLESHLNAELDAFPPEWSTSVAQTELSFLILFNFAISYDTTSLFLSASCPY